MTTTPGMIRPRRHPARSVLLSRVLPTSRAATSSLWRHQGRWSRRTGTMGPTRGTLWPAMPPCASQLKRTELAKGANEKAAETEGSSLSIWTYLNFELLKHKHMHVYVCRDEVVHGCNADSGPSSKASSGCWRRLSRSSRTRHFSSSSKTSSSNSSRHSRRFSRSVSLSSYRWVSNIYREIKLAEAQSCQYYQKLSLSPW